MMGRQEDFQGQLFYHNICLDERIRVNHPLRRINKLIDFDFIYKEVANKYGGRGNVSVAPPVILKLMLLLVFYNVRSERELLVTLPERLDWLWFLGFDLDSETPNHSVLSKARAKWGEDIFRQFFERIVWQCVEAGLVDGSKIFMDSSLVDANASNDSVIDKERFKFKLAGSFDELQSRLDEPQKSEVDDESDDDNSEGKGKTNRRFVSTTDPDATLTRRGTSKLRYQIHRSVDGQKEVITATTVTAGTVNEAHLLIPLVEDHERNTEKEVSVVVADSKYGTIKNYLACYEQGIKAHIPDMGKIITKRNLGLFADSLFKYDPDKDIYHCPNGTEMKMKSLHIKRNSMDYAAPKKVCESCHLREQCTTNKMGRTVTRHLQHEKIQLMRERASSDLSKSDLQIRQHLMERSFARAKRYGFDRARWRRLWRMKIQEYLTCAIQNIEVLMRHTRKPDPAKAQNWQLPWLAGFFNQGWEEYVSEPLHQIQRAIKISNVLAI